MIADEPQTTCQAFQATAAKYPDAVALRTPGGESVITWRQYALRVRAIAAGLAALGVRHGDTVGIMLTNRPEFHLVDTGALHAGATPFSAYNTLAPEQLNHVLCNAGNRVLVCERRFLPVIRVSLEGTSVEHIVCVDAEPEDALMSLADLEAGGDPDFDFDAAWRAVAPTDLLTIIYTSGTTGPSKGVELTNGNGAAMRTATEQIVTCSHEDRVISYLPDAHIANRLMAHYAATTYGCTVTTVADLTQLLTALQEVRPTFFMGVPHVWYKLKAGVEMALAQEPSPLKRRLAHWAIDVGRRTVRRRLAGQELPRVLAVQHAVADRLVLSEIRAKIGFDQIRLALSGAASIAPDVMEFLLAIGIPCCEVWGMSETVGGGLTNRPGRIRIGTVGQPTEGSQIKLAADGELLISGPLVLRGYRNNPEKSAEAIDADGWLHTGDIANIDGDGYVRIVDRKKELIITAGGKNMSPSNIENAIRAASPLIGGAVVIGNDRPYITALLTLDPDAAAAFAQGNGIDDATPAALAENPLVRAALDAAVDTANARVSHVEMVKKFTLLPTAWEPGGVELTPTLKLRRKPIDAKYAAEIEALYAGTLG